MKKISIIILSLAILSSCSLISNVNWDPAQLENAAGYALTAATLNNQQVVALSQKTVIQQDAKNTIDTGKYDTRLRKLMAGITEVDGLPLNYKVYKLDEINAFACGDGSIRVYSGLMDVMNDDELIAIIGHEIGHVVHHDTRDAMKKAYKTAAARSVVNAAGAVGALAQTALGDIAETYISSQFSQKQEYAADDYGFKFAIAHGHTPYSMYNALSKLVSLSNGSKASAVQKMFSSHPDSASRAAKMKEKADKYSAK